ncbi:MAG: Gfo/Idh/MocA family oxidoreductase [Planctomycetota bacterium]
MANKTKIGILGCGNISPQYFKWCKTFEILEIVACADLDIALARKKAVKFQIPKACSVVDLLADPEIEIIINLTPPAAHAETNQAILKAGKHVCAEKPLAVTLEEGQKTLAMAKRKNRMIACAPDTFLGGGLQTCRKLLDEGRIGEPVAASAFIMGHGPEQWHPNPFFFYAPGAGPMFDLGVYYVTALVTLLGAVNRVSASARISFPERMIPAANTTPGLAGKKIQVTTPTHITGAFEFVSGVLATIIASFDVWQSSLPRIEIYGSEGTLIVPDPNTFKGPVKIHRAGESDWSQIPLTHSVEVGRGIGCADLAYSIQTKRAPRASGEQAFHVLEIMHACLKSAETGKHVAVKSRMERPRPLPTGLAPGKLDP